MNILISRLECARPWGWRDVIVEYDDREHIERIYFISNRREHTVTSHAEPEDLARFRREIAEQHTIEAEIRREA